MTSKLLLHPFEGTVAAGSLLNVYKRAFSEATELYVLSAYLTEWKTSLVLNKACKEFRLIVGGDYGVTRKSALLAAHEWLTPSRRRNFLAHKSVPGRGFHPKVMFWRRSDGKRFALFGSSNLTRAAFDTNVEGNIAVPLDEAQYAKAVDWVRRIQDSCEPVTKAWIEKYQEARRTRSPKKDGEGEDPEDSGIQEVFPWRFDWPDAADTKNGRTFAQVLKRRQAERVAFDTSAKAIIEKLIRQSARSRTWSQLDNLNFYNRLKAVWIPGNRMGGNQWVILGKHASHAAFSKAFVSILDADEANRDEAVVKAIDSLAAADVSTRGAVLSEMLCHFFPTRYPLYDEPVKKWRRRIGFDKRQGGTEGERYLRLAHALRAALNTNPVLTKSGLRDLAELDALIWFVEAD